VARRAAVFLVTFLTISGYAQTISGIVADSQKIPIPGASVSLIVEMGGCPSTVTRTGTDGRFQFSNAQPGRYRVKAAKAGYVTQEFGEREKHTPGFGATILLTPSTPNADIKIVLLAGSEIRGTVYDEQGRLLAGGYVFFHDPQRPSQSFFARTDSNGRYRVTDLPPGKFYVSARRFSEEANQVVGDLWYYPGTTDQNLASLVPLSESPALVDIHFGGLERAAGVVQVRTEQGLPVARAEVAVRRRGETYWEHEDTLRTGAGGRAEIRKLPPGEYCAFILKLPPPLASWRNPAAEATSADRYAKRFHVAPGDGPAQIDFAVGSGVELTGRFVMRDGGALPPGHAISLDLLSTPDVAEFTGSMSFQVPPARLDNDGFAFQGLWPDERYTLREFQRDHLKTFVMVGIRLNGASLRGDDIVLRGGAATTTLEIVLDRGAVISGVVNSDPHAKSAKARRVAGDAPAAVYPETTTTEVVKGRFVFRGLPAGTYVISVPGSERTQEAEVKAGDVVEIEL
jgi:hypothetical protein